MKILITGGAGFIGSHIADKLLSLGHQIFIIDNLSTGKSFNLPKKAVFYREDIQDKKAVETIFTKVLPDVLIHQAAQLDVRKSVKDPIYDAKVNIIGLLNLLECSRIIKVSKVLFASSGGVVYGDATIIPTPEDYNPLRPLSPYGVAKLTSENYLYYYYKTYGIKYVALRYANIYGPRQDPFGEAGVVAIFTQKMLKNEQPVINGDGKQTRDYTYVGDVVMANVKALSTDYTGPLNIGTSIQTNVNTIYRLLLKLTGSTVKEIHGPAKLGEQQKSCLDITLSAKTIGYKPQTSLTQGLDQTVAYFKSI